MNEAMADLKGAWEVKAVMSNSKIKKSPFHKSYRWPFLHRIILTTLTGKNPGGIGPPGIPSAGICPSGLGAGPAFCI